MIQTFLHAYVGKDWLNDGQTPGIDLLALRRVDLSFHLFDQAGLKALDLHRQIPARSIQLVQTLGSHKTSCTIFLTGTVNIIHSASVMLVASLPLQDLALRTAIDLFDIIEDKISIWEPLFFFR